MFIRKDGSQIFIEKTGKGYKATRGNVSITFSSLHEAVMWAEGITDDTQEKTDTERKPEAG